MPQYCWMFQRFLEALEAPGTPPPMWGHRARGARSVTQGARGARWGEGEQGSKTGGEEQGSETYVILGFRVPTTCDEKVWWHHVVLRCPLGFRCPHTMAPYSGAVQWHHSVALYSGAVQWCHTVPLYNGAIQWHRTMAPYSGTIQSKLAPCLNPLTPLIPVLLPSLPLLLPHFSCPMPSHRWWEP